MRVVCRGPMTKVTHDSLWRETANNRARPLWDPDFPWRLSFVNQVFVPRVDAIAEVSRCGHSGSNERRIKMARRALATPQQAPESSPDKHSRSLEERADRTPYFKRNSGGLVIFGWNCTLQDVSSQASHISALRLIASGK